MPFEEEKLSPDRKPSCEVGISCSLKCIANFRTKKLVNKNRLLVSVMRFVWVNLCIDSRVLSSRKLDTNAARGNTSRAENLRDIARFRRQGRSVLSREGLWTVSYQFLRMKSGQERGNPLETLNCHNKQKDLAWSTEEAGCRLFRCPMLHTDEHGFKLILCVLLPFITSTCLTS